MHKFKLVFNVYGIKLRYKCASRRENRQIRNGSEGETLRAVAVRNKSL